MVNYIEKGTFNSLQETALNDSIEISHPFMNPLLLSNSRVEQYEDLVINLSFISQEELERKMDLLPREDKEINIDLLLEAFDKPHLSDPIWKHPNFPLYALLALKEKKIDGMDFSTSQMFYNVINHPNNQGQIQEIPLFINDSNNPQAWSLIEETVQNFISQDHQEISQHCFLLLEEENLFQDQPFMTSSQQQVFFDMVLKLRPLQRRFLLISEPIPLYLSRHKQLSQNLDFAETITEVINVKNPGFNVFCRVSTKEFGKPLRMIPSKGMMQAYLFATGGDCTLISQFSLSSSNYLHQAITLNERCMALNFAFLPKIQKADGRLCLEQASEVEYHDFYHIDILSLIKSDKSKFDGMAKLIMVIAKEIPRFKNIIKVFYERIVDMDAVFYRIFYSVKVKNESRSQIEDALFWSNIWYYLKFLSTGFGIPDHLLIEFFQLICKKLIEEADYYQISYKLNLEFILNLELSFSQLILPLQTKDFAGLKIFYAFIKNYLNFSHLSLKELLALSEHSGSYLVRNAAAKKLAKTFKLETMSSFLIQAKNRKILTAYFSGLDFIIKQFQNLVDHPTLSSEEKELLYNELRSSPYHFEYLIKSIVLENNITNFNFLMGVDKKFIRKQLNRVFNDGLTLWQTAAFKKHKEMMVHLISLGARPIGSFLLSDEIVNVS